MPGDPFSGLIGPHTDPHEVEALMDIEIKTYKTETHPTYALLILNYKLYFSY